MMKTLLFSVAACLAAAGTAFGQGQPVPAPARSNPIVELTLGFDGPVHEAAEFPGIALAGAVLIPRGDRFGFGVVGEIDAAYLHARLIQPGIGVTYGGLHKAVHIQIDYHHLADPVITKSGKTGEPVTTETLPNYRFMFGFTWRLCAR
jgi:hypothetical protein